MDMSTIISIMVGASLFLYVLFLAKKEIDRQSNKIRPLEDFLALVSCPDRLIKAIPDGKLEVWMVKGLSQKDFDDFLDKSFRSQPAF